MHSGENVLRLHSPLLSIDHLDNGPERDRLVLEFPALPADVQNQLVLGQPEEPSEVCIRDEVSRVIRMGFIGIPPLPVVMLVAPRAATVLGTALAPARKSGGVAIGCGVRSDR